MFLKGIAIDEKIASHLSSSSDSADGLDDSFDSEGEPAYKAPKIEDIKYKIMKYKDLKRKIKNMKNQLERDKNCSMWSSLYYTFFSNTTKSTKSVTLN